MTAETQQPPRMVEEPSRAGRREEIIRDLVSVIVLSTTAVLTAWCEFEA